jgi:hypothetical protein
LRFIAVRDGWAQFFILECWIAISNPFRSKPPFPSNVMYPKKFRKNGNLCETSKLESAIYKNK